jgi:sec-independent protein translocase protein TatC
VSLVPFPGSSVPSAEPPPDDDLWHGDENASETVGGRMSFLEHLDELRKRLTVSVAVLGVGFLIAFVFVEKLYNFVMAPLAAMLPHGPDVLSTLDPKILKALSAAQITALKNAHGVGGQMIYTEPMEGFILRLKIAFLAGIILSAPLILWQVWLFISPGLYRKEKKLAIPFVVLSTAGFVSGAAFTHYVLFPFMWTFLASFSNEYTVFAPKITEVFSLYTKMLLGMGLVFQMPTLVYTLARMRIVTARFLIKNFKYAFLMIFVLAAVITPSGDMLTQTLFAAPMVGLYIISIGIAWAVAPRRKPAPEARSDR